MNCSDYPDVLNHPAAEVLATFHEKQAPVSALFDWASPLSVELGTVVARRSGMR